MYYTFHHDNCFAKRQSLCDSCSAYCYQIEGKSCLMYYTGIMHGLLCIEHTHTHTQGNRKQPSTDIKSEVFNVNLPSDRSMNLCKQKVHVHMCQRIYPAELRSTHVVFPHPYFSLCLDTPVCSPNGSIHTPQDVHHCYDL